MGKPATVPTPVPESVLRNVGWKICIHVRIRLPPTECHPPSVASVQEGHMAGEGNGSTLMERGDSWQCGPRTGSAPTERGRAHSRPTADRDPSEGDDRDYRSIRAAVAVFARDGYRCRYCQRWIVSRGVLRAFHSMRLLPNPVSRQGKCSCRMHASSIHPPNAFSTARSTSP